MTQPVPPAGYFPPQPPAPAQGGYAPQYAPQQPPPGYAPQYAPAPGYAPQYAPQQPPPGYGAPQGGYAAPQQGAPQGPPQPALARGTLDDWLNQSGGSGAENITKIFNDPTGRPKPYGSVTVSFLIARKVLQTDMRQQTNAQNQAQVGFDGAPLFVLIVPCVVLGSTDGSHAQLFPDGQASWWVKGQPKDALAAAMMTAGAPLGFPEEGARIDLTLTGERASKRAGHNPSKQYSVVYTRPATAVNQPQPDLSATALQAPQQPAQQAPVAPVPQAPQQPAQQVPLATPATIAAQAAGLMDPGQPYAQQPAPGTQYADPAQVYAPVTPAAVPPQQPPQEWAPQAPQAWAPQQPQQYAPPAPQYADPAQAYAQATGQQPPQQYAQPPAQPVQPPVAPYPPQQPQQPPQQYAQQPGQVPFSDLTDEQRRMMSELRANGAVPAAPVS